jgi:hypothetical protein
MTFLTTREEVVSYESIDTRMDRSSLNLAPIIIALFDRTSMPSEWIRSISCQSPVNNFGEKCAQFERPEQLAQYEIGLEAQIKNGGLA